MNHSATYCPTENKLRLYPACRLDKETYDRVKKAGFSWAPRQELFVAPMWTPAREDLLIELCGEIGDETISMEERAAQRAERFSGFSDRRAADAERATKVADSIAGGIPFGQPILVGHHSEKHARKHAQKIENNLKHAARLWDTSAYWISRAQGAMHHAEYKARPEVTARRIKTIEADRRKALKIMTEAQSLMDLWNREGLTKERAIKIAGAMGYVTVQTEGSKYGSSIWSLLESGEWDETQAKEWSLAHYQRVIEWQKRWMAHYDNRLAYERALLGEVAGDRPISSGEEIKVGGTIWVGEESAVVLKVNKGAEGRAVSVKIDRSIKRVYGGAVPVERITKYQAPDEAQAKAAKVAAKAPPIVNYPGEGFLHMTKAEWAKRHSDYKSVRHATSEGFGPYRVRTTIDHKTHSTVRVYITDEKVKERPPITERISLEAAAPKETPTEPAKAVERVDRSLYHERSKKAQELKQAAKTGVRVVSANQLFPTPTELAWRMVSEADIEKGMTILEPSAGTGRILDAIYGEWNGSVNVMAIEINQSLVNSLIGCSRYPGAAIFCNDFLTATPSPYEQFDRVLMNPPFDNGDDIKHILHAWTFLKPGGRLVAICANGPRQQMHLRDGFVRQHGGTWEDLPDGTFESSGTNVRTALLIVDK